MLKSNYYFSKIGILNILISAVPFSLICGNLVTNINILLICVYGFFLFGKEIFNVENKSSYLIYTFFIYLIFITFYNNIFLINENEIYLDNMLKSIYYLRFLLVFFIINLLTKKNLFNTKIFFTFCAFLCLIISFDITFQFFFKKNLIGLSITNYRPSSFFNTENIAGGYIQRFSFFLLFFLFIKFKNFFLQKEINKFILFSLFFTSIFFTGNRMPTAIFIMSIFIYYLIEKKFKEVLIFFIVASVIVFSFLKIPTNSKLHHDTNIFFKEGFEIIKKAPIIFNSNDALNLEKWGTGYLVHFNTGIQIWKKNKLFGNGLKSFRLKCTYEKNQTCNTHPHNYFIELLVDTGIVGVIIIYSIFAIGIFKFFSYYFSQKNLNSRLTVLAFFIPIFFEFFPIRSSGSFFTTSNSAFIFLMLPLFLNLKKLNKLK